MKGTNLISEGKVKEGLLLFEKGIESNKVDYMTKIRYAFLELKFGDIKKKSVICINKVYLHKVIRVKLKH